VNQFRAAGLEVDFDVDDVIMRAWTRTHSTYAKMNPRLRKIVERRIVVKGGPAPEFGLSVKSRH
jgi:hypothetical protein